MPTITPGAWVTGTVHENWFADPTVGGDTPGTGGVIKYGYVTGEEYYSTTVGNSQVDTYSPDKWGATVTVDSVAWPGLNLYEPWDELAADSTAVGWQHEGGPQYLDWSACDANGVLDLYDAWWDAGGESDYYAWYYEQYDPYTSGYYDVDITASYTAEGIGDNVTIGSPASIYLLDGYKVCATSVLTGVSGTTLGNALGNYQIAMPGTHSISPWGDVIVAAWKLTDIPPALGVTSTGWASGNGYPYGAAVSRPWRLLAVGARPSAVRRFPRGDGLVFGPRRHFATAGSGQQGGSRIGYR